MSYLVGPSDTGVGESMIPWANYDTAYSFRVGSSPAVCNGFLLDYGMHHLDQFNENDACAGPRYFKQVWSTSFPQRDFEVDAKTKAQMAASGFFERDAGWDITDPFDIGETTDTSRDKTKGTHTYEIVHQYDGDGRIICSGDSSGAANQPGCDGVFDQLVWDIGHQITLDNWSEYNAVAGAFLSHPDVLTRTDEGYLALPALDGTEKTLKDDFADLKDPYSFLEGYGTDTGRFKPDYFRRGNFIMHVQGMEGTVGKYISTSNVKTNNWRTGMALITSNPSGKAEDFSTGGMNCPVMTLADNPFWRADPTMWGPILRNLKMDVMPYCAPTRKTRPVMYRFWDKPYPTALYGGPVFHCVVAGNTTGKLSMANVPYYRKFLRDFMASDDSIMAWRASLGLPERDSARYPHNYANYWKVVDANKGSNALRYAPGEHVKDITDTGYHAIWADMPQQKSMNDMQCPTEFVGVLPGTYYPSRVGQTQYITVADPSTYDQARGGDYSIKPQYDQHYSPSRANHYVLLSRYSRTHRGKLAALGLSDADTTLVYPPSKVNQPLTKMTMDSKRKLHRKNMHATNSTAFHDFFATMFSFQKGEGGERRGEWEDAHLSHRIVTDALGIVSDGEVALLRDMMDKILKGADLSTILPDGVLNNDKRAVSGWWSSEIAQTVLMGLEEAKWTQLKEFRKWSMTKGKALVGPEFRRFCEWTKTAYPRLGKVVASFFETLEMSVANADLTMIDGGISFGKAITEAFANAGIAAGVTALQEVLSSKLDPGKVSRAVMNKLKNAMAQSKTAFKDFYEFQVRGDASMAAYVEEWNHSGSPFIDIRKDMEWQKKTGRLPTASKMRFRSEEVYEKWRKEFYERLSTFVSDIEKVDERMGYMPEGLQTAISELYENVEAGRGVEMLFTDVTKYASPFLPNHMGLDKLAPKIVEWQKQVDGMKDWYRDYMSKYGATPWEIDQRGIQVTFAESFKGNVKPVLETSAAQPCELHPDTFLPDAESIYDVDEEIMTPISTPYSDDAGDFDEDVFEDDLPVAKGPTAAEDAQALADGLTEEDILARKAAYQKFLEGAAQAKREGKMLNRTGLLPTDGPDILGRNYFDYDEVLNAPEGGEVESAALDLMKSAAPEIATAEAAEGLAMTSIMAAGAELAPLILLFGVTELLDYLQKQAEEAAARAEAYQEQLGIMNNFYEANVKLNRNFFTESELSRLRTLGVDPDAKVDTNADPFFRSIEDTSDKGIHWGTDTDGTPWVRFDLLTKLIVMNFMSLSMVDNDFLTTYEGIDPEFLAYRLRQQEWLSTCEMIRTMRLVDHHIRAPMWADSPTEEKDEGAFLPYHFPLTNEVPNGMIKEFMTPIPCVTPFDNGYVGADKLDVKKDLYALIFADHERETEVKVIPNPRIDALQQQMPVNPDGEQGLTWVLPTDAEAQVKADAKRAGIKEVTRIDVEVDNSGNGYVVYYHLDGKDVAYVTPEALVWDKIIKDPRYARYGTIPTPFVVTKMAPDPLTGKDVKIFDICEPVPVWAPDKSPTLFISSADPTFAWPTLREQGGNMNYLAKELNYFDTHKFTLVGEDGVSVLAAGNNAIGNRQSRLIVQPNPSVSISGSVIVVLTDSPEYSDAKWEAVKKAMAIDDTTDIRFLRAELDLGATSGTVTVPVPPEMLDDMGVPKNPLDDKDYRIPIPEMSTVIDYSVDKKDTGGGGYQYQYTFDWSLNAIPLSANDWYQYDYPHPLRVIDFSKKEGEEYSFKPDPPVYAVQDANGLWIPPAAHLRGEGYIPDGATFTRWEAYAIRAADSGNIMIDVPPNAIQPDGSVTDPSSLTLPIPDGAIIESWDLEGNQYIIYYMVPETYGIEFYYQLRDSSFPDMADYIIDFASTIDWVAFEKPGTTGTTYCGELPPKRYQYMVVSDGPFSMDNFTTFPLLLGILNGKPQPETMKDYPTPDALVPYLDLIKNLCYWLDYGFPPKITNEVSNGINFVTFDASPLKSIQNMSALPIVLLQFDTNGAAVTGVNQLARFDPGSAQLDVPISGNFAFVLAAEVEGGIPDGTFGIRTEKEPTAGEQTTSMDFWRDALLWDRQNGFGHVGRSLVMQCKPEDGFHLLVFDNPDTMFSPKLTKVKALFAQILSLTTGTTCYSILRSFIQDFTYESLKPPSREQERICAWILRHIRIDTSGADGPRVTPHTVERQIALYHVGKALSKPDEFDAIYRKPYDVRAFLKTHDFKIGDDCIAPYGPPTIENDGPYLTTDIRLEESKDNPGWAQSYSYLGMGLPDETREITNLLISLQEMAGPLGSNRAIVDDVLNNRLTDLEALPKCKSSTSQHENLVAVLHLAERVRRLRVNTVMRKRATEDDDMLEVLADHLEKTPDVTLTATNDIATAGFIDLIRKLPAIREHRTVVGKSAFYTLSNHEAVCCQACKESYKDIGRSGLSTSTGEFYYIDSLSSPEMAYFYNPHSQHLIVACRGTSVQKDLNKGNLETGTLDDLKAAVKNPPSMFASLKRKLSSAMSPMSDLYTDFMIVVGKQAGSPRLTSALEEVKSIVKGHAIKSVTTTGHSLGGSIATFVHQNLFEGGVNSSCVIFNPGIGMDQEYFDLVALERTGKGAEWAKHLTTFHVAGESGSLIQSDPVSFLSGGIGESKRQKAVTGAGVPTRLKAHSISNFHTGSVDLMAHVEYQIPKT